MIIEGRTICTLEELQDFCIAAVASSHADPATVRLRVPQDMRILPDGRKVYDVSVSPVA
jgi:hypothetical protein